MTPAKHCLVSDDDGHWYVVPVEHKDAFHRWVQAVGFFWEQESEGDEPARPEWAQEVGGSPSRVEFENPVIP